jgi:hypothetical protein
VRIECIGTLYLSDKDVGKVDRGLGPSSLVDCRIYKIGILYYGHEVTSNPSVPRWIYADLKLQRPKGSEGSQIVVSWLPLELAADLKVTGTADHKHYLRLARSEPETARNSERNRRRGDTGIGRKVSANDWPRTSTVNPHELIEVHREFRPWSEFRLDPSLRRGPKGVTIVGLLG